MKDKIMGVLYGMAIGDALGMPPELWSRKRLKKEFGRIEDFLPGHPKNEISFQYKAGNFTDDTSQALLILDSLIETDFVPDEQNIAKHILEWAKKENAFEKNILGPTSKAALKLWEEGKSAKEISDCALTNGSAMRIAPVGILFYPEQKKELCDYVAAVSRVTHSSDIAIAGAAMIAMAVASMLAYGDREKMLVDVCDIEEYALSLGAETASPLLSTRIRYGIELARKYSDDSETFLEKLYNMMGAGVNIAESVPCAVAIAYYGSSAKECAVLSANLGGDTDTIGAMAAAIRGGADGIRYQSSRENLTDEGSTDGIDVKDIELIKRVNQVDFEKYATALMNRRGKLT